MQEEVDMGIINLRVRVQILKHVMPDDFVIFNIKLRTGQGGVSNPYGNILYSS